MGERLINIAPVNNSHLNLSLLIYIVDMIVIIIIIIEFLL